MMPAPLDLPKARWPWLVRFRESRWAWLEPWWFVSSINVERFPAWARDFADHSEAEARTIQVQWLGLHVGLEIGRTPPRITAAVVAAEHMIREQREAAGTGAQALGGSTAIISGDGDTLEWFGYGGGGRQAGVNVTPETAMKMATLSRCVHLIAGAVMSARPGIYRRKPNGGKELVEDHPYTRFLVAEANDDTSAAEFQELQAIAVLMRGNGYGLLRQAKNGVLHDIDYYHSARVMPYRSGSAIWYRFTNLDGSIEDHHSSEVLHFKNAGQSVDGLRALSPIAMHAQAIGIGLAAREYTSGQFERGLLTNDYFGFAAGTSPTKEQREDFKAYLRRRATGVGNAHNPLILENGAEWKRVGISAKEAQLLELLQFTANDVATAYGVPPHMAGLMEKASAWGTGIEEMSLGFDRYTVMPHRVRFAAEYTRKLFPIIGAKQSEFFVDYDIEGQLRGNSKALSDYLKAMLGGNQLPGWGSQNEARRIVGLPPLPDGDTVYKPTGAPVPGQPTVAPEKEPDDAP